MADLKAFAEQLVNLTVKEVNELANILKEEYGIEPAAAAVAVAAGPAAAAAPAEETAVEEIVVEEAGEGPAKYVCSICGYVYDPAVGDPEHGIPAGTRFEDLPEDWKCPRCKQGKDKFNKA